MSTSSDRSGQRCPLCQLSQLTPARMRHTRYSVPELPERWPACVGRLIFLALLTTTRRVILTARWNYRSDSVSSLCESNSHWECVFADRPVVFAIRIVKCFINGP